MPSRPRRERRGLLGGSGFDQNLYVHLVAEDSAVRGQIRQIVLPLKTKVVAIDLGMRIETSDRPAVLARFASQILNIQGHPTGDVFEGQLSFNAVLIRFDTPNPVAAEHDLREHFDVQEFGGPNMIVPFDLIGFDAARVQDRLYPG